MRRLRNVKIVATLGPASSDYEMIRALVRGGGRRVPPEHEPRDPRRHPRAPRDHSPGRGRMSAARSASWPTCRARSCASASLPKGRRRTGRRRRVPDGPGPAPRATVERVNLPHPEIFAALEPGASLLVNDGKIRLKVESCGKDFADCTVTVGGTISNRKGVNVPGRGAAGGGAVGKGPRAIWNSPASWAWTGWRCPSCSGPRT